MAQRSAPRFGLAILAGLAVLVAGWALLYLSAPPGEYGFEEQSEVYRVNGGWLLMHVVPGAVALAVGALLFVARAFSAPGAFHRLAGALYVLSVICAGVAALGLAITAYGGVSNVVGFTLLAMLWMLTTFLAVYRASLGDFEGHHLWMVRSYALTFAAVTLRLETGLLVAAGLSFDDAYLVVPWSSWSLNLVFAEWILLKKRARQA